MIHGEKVVRPKKEGIAAKIALLLGLPNPYVSGGASVDSRFLDDVHQKIDGDPTGGTITYRKAQILLERLGLTYDPYWDTSELTEDGGGTVTTRAYSRIHSVLARRPRCFMLNVTDAPVGNRWEVNHSAVYRYDETVTARRPFNEAGPGSCVVYYATGSSMSNPQHFIATATVAYIAPGWTGPWEAHLENYLNLPHPVPGSDLTMPKWNHQHAITEITYETYQAIVAAGAGDGAVLSGPAAPDTEGDQPSLDPGGAEVALRVVQDFPIETAEPVIDVPDVLPSPVGPVAGIKEPWYIEAPDGQVIPGSVLGSPFSRNPTRDKLAERRAIELVEKAMSADGWHLSRDCQKDGVGYDLEFTKGGRGLKVEVKGVQGSALTFNLTPKEYWRAATDSNWAVIAVTGVLTPKDYKLHFITGDRVAAAIRIVTGYRIDVRQRREQP